MSQSKHDLMIEDYERQRDFIRETISTTLSTLVKEMEGLKSQLCECGFPDEQMNRCRNCKKVIEDKRTANEGISAAVEVVKKMGV